MKHFFTFLKNHSKFSPNFAKLGNIWSNAVLLSEITLNFAKLHLHYNFINNITKLQLHKIRLIYEKFGNNKSNFVQLLEIRSNIIT